MICFHDVAHQSAGGQTGISAIRVCDLPEHDDCKENTFSPAQPAARAPQAKIRGLRREKEHFSIDFRRNALPTATESCRAIVRDVQRIGAALLRAGALDRRHHMLWRRWQRRGEPAARPFGELYARWRVITVAQWRRTARHRSRCRPRASAQAARRPHHH